MSYILSFFFAAGYGYYMYYRERKDSNRFSYKASRIIKGVHYTCLIACMVITILYLQYGIVLKGHLTNRIIIWIVLITGIFFYLYNSVWRNGLEKWYFRIFSFLPIFLSVVLSIPFIGIVILASLFGRLILPDAAIYNDNNLIVRRSFNGVLAPPNLDVWQKHYMFNELKHTLYKVDIDVDSVTVNYTETTARLHFYSRYAQSNYSNTDTVFITLD